MTTQQVWLITGASRGLGVHLAKKALAAGHLVVATSRNPHKVKEAVGPHDNLIALKLDVLAPNDAEVAVAATLQRHGKLDVLINNAGNFYAGFFEELTPDQVRQQVETLLFGPMNVTRAALPAFRKQRSGLVVTVSSTAGIVGGMFCSAYAAGKFGVEGWMESLAAEIAPFGIKTMLVEPGFFRTELLSPESTTFATPVIQDYADRSQQTITAWSGMNGKQGGDASKLASAVVQLAGSSNPPGRFAGGADAVQTFEAKARELLEQAAAHRELSSSMAHEDS
ncbi:SDR family oxidoreductase [Pseudomonas syringae group genomosp. 3]|uniref:Short-chain alcohol dehydrogenase n=1 Tax=Pseudomonas syringae pv. viburni TaxID=251703 RepID=A0A0Q0GH92_9PSED|nr:SDR family oxidoreductase [Pseudomonas syringae group genomosp. 3]KPZ13031.1 Short-chain alcohol dehydrogenase [Pseudomonas syringae pv. viburni]